MLFICLNVIFSERPSLTTQAKAVQTLSITLSYFFIRTLFICGLYYFVIHFSQLELEVHKIRDLPSYISQGPFR